MAKRCGKASSLSDSTEIPFTPDVFQFTSSKPMPIKPPDTSSLTAMPELFHPTVIADDIDWRQHPKWKPLVSTPSRSTPIPKGTLVPDPSPAHTFSDTEISTLMDPSPAGSYIHRRRQGEYVKRPPVWSLNGLGGENSYHLLESNDLGFDTSARGEDIPFPLKISTNLPVGLRQVSKGSLAVSDIKLPSYSCEDQINQMATAFTMDPFIVNAAQDMTTRNLSRLEASTGRASAGPIIEQWVRSTPPPRADCTQSSCHDGTTRLAVDPRYIEPSDAILPSINNQGRSGLGHLDGEAPVNGTVNMLPSMGQAIRSKSHSPRTSVGDLASASHVNANGDQPRANIQVSTESHHGDRHELLSRYRDIRTAPPTQGETEFVHWILPGSRVTCVNATHIATASDNDNQFELKLGHQYLVSKIFDDQWALCIKCDTTESLKIHQHGTLGKSIRKKLMNTLRSKAKKPTTPRHMEKVEHDRNIINFLPLCAVTLEANYEAYLGMCGSMCSMTNSSSSCTRVMESQRSPPKGGIVQAPKRNSSQTEAVKIREAGFVEVPEHIFIASQVGPLKEPYVTVHAIRSGSRKESAPMQRIDGQDTAKQPFKSLGRYIGKKSVGGRKAWKDATQRLRKGKSFGDLLERPSHATTVRPAAQAFQTEEKTTKKPREQASEDPSNDFSSQAPEDHIPRATNRGELGSGESREPLLSLNNEATAATSTSLDGANDSVQQPTSSQSFITVKAALAAPMGSAITDLASEQQLSHIPAPAAMADLSTTAPASSTPPPNAPAPENLAALEPTTPSKAAQPSPSPAGTPVPTPTGTPATIPPSRETGTDWATYGDQAIPSFSHVEFIGEPDSFFDLAWGLVLGLNDAPIPLPR